MQESSEKMLTVADVSHLSRLSQKTVRKLIVTGNLPAIKLGGSVRIMEGEFWKWLETCHVFPRPLRQKKAI